MNFDEFDILSLLYSDYELPVAEYFLNDENRTQITYILLKYVVTMLLSEFFEQKTPTQLCL